MTSTDNLAVWQEWCYYLTPKHSIDREDLFTQKLITLLEKRGWSQFAKELECERTVPVGRGQTIRLDILLNHFKSNKCIVIEMKRPGLCFTEGCQNQLFSYMRQVKADVGLLVGSHVEVYFEEPGGFAGEMPQHLFSLSFDETNSLGPCFVEAIQKEQYGTEESLKKLLNMAEQYKSSQSCQSIEPSVSLHNIFKPTKNSTSRVANPPVANKGANPEVIAIMERWLAKGRTTPWGHTLVRGGTYSQAGLIDACLCVEGGMTRSEIARNSGVLFDRATDHIDRDLKIGKRNNNKPAKIKTQAVGRGVHEYIDPSDQPF